MVFRLRSKTSSNINKDKGKTSSLLGFRKLGRDASKTFDETASVTSDDPSDRNDASNGNGVRVTSLLRGSSSLEGSSIDAFGVKEQTLEDPLVEEEEDIDQEVRFTDKDGYGQRHPIETPSLIARRLKAFDAAVNALPKKKRATLNQAVEKCPELLTEAFKLQFLRCECFHVKRAATRYAKYWDRRLDVFGPAKAFLPMTLEGALKDDHAALSMGLFRLVSHKDSAERTILFGDAARQDFHKYSTESMIRAIWYMFHAALEDEVTQQRGVIVLTDLKAACFALLDHELARVVALSVCGCLPVRLSAIHGCSPPRVFWVIFPILKILLGERLRKRIKIHTESVNANLIQYGMDKETHPLEIGGELVLDHDAWLEHRRSQQL